MIFRQTKIWKQLQPPTASLSTLFPVTTLLFGCSCITGLISRNVSDIRQFIIICIPLLTDLVILTFLN